MEPEFNIDRPKVSDDEINRHKNFDSLVKDFKERSLKQAQGDESWWKNKKIRYTTVIAGVTVICTITYLSLFKNQKQNQATHETLITSNAPKENTSHQKPFVDAPSQKLKIPYTAYKVNNAKGGDLVHPTSSKIKIPKNSFVNKEGKDVIGDVTIEYREFHDAGDIIASGIPMAYDSAGAHNHLESAGMFEIKGSQNGEPVFIKPGHPVEVQLASANNEDRFNQYFLDTVSKNWQYLKKDKMHALNQKKIAATVHQPIHTEKLPAESPKLLALKNQVEKVLPKRIDSVKVVYIKKADMLPKSKEPLKPSKPVKGRPTFRLDGSYNEFPELAAFDNVIFEVGPENTNYSPELHEITWSDVKISQGPVKGKNYILNLVYRNRSEKLIVYPVLSGADFDKAQNIYEKKLADYEQLKEKRVADEQRLMAEMQAKQQAYLAELKRKQDEYDKEKARIMSSYQLDQQDELANSFNNLSNAARATRIFSISQFGIFNSDCPHAVPQGGSVRPIFISDRNQALNPDYIYVIDHNTKSVYTLSRQNGFNFAYNPANAYSVCVFTQNKMYLCGKNEFRQTIGRGENKFTVKALPESADNLIDFKKALDI